jgi:hypothetical protein
MFIMVISAGLYFSANAFMKTSFGAKEMIRKSQSHILRIIKATIISDHSIKDKLSEKLIWEKNERCIDSREALFHSI